MNRLLTAAIVTAALAAGFLLGIRYAYSEERRWIIKGERLPY